ncbi:MAG: hypothetical protein HOP11_00295 [Saprospiraceae bacterium]|nr:hypothetical protein [Saprospiraceae bacterium]
MAENRITIRHTIFIAKPRTLVWDYTQNYDNRRTWDSSVIETTVLQAAPNRIVRLKMRGNTSMTFIYKLDERPHKTSLAAKEIISPFIVNAGGSWIYKEKNGGTLWTQTNTIDFKQNFILKLLMPIFKFAFGRLTKKAMGKAKLEIEKL